MSIEDEIFRKGKVDYQKLIDYGFKKIDDYYVFETNFLDDMMQAKIVIDKNNMINGTVYDLSTNLEYTNFRLENIGGEFVSTVKDEYEKILIDIREKCFTIEYYAYPQSNRIIKLISDRYQVLPEFLWEDYPEFAIFRNKRSSKWFALIMNIDKDKLDKNSKGNIDVLNIKLDSEVINYLNTKGIYPAYHMNKKSWVTIKLDDTLNDEEIMILIDKSYNLNKILGVWLVPVNPKYYDIVNAFNDNDTIIWKQSNNILKDDIVFLYVAAPYSCVMYKCLVIDANIPYNYQDKFVKMDKVMKIKLLKKYNDNEFTLDRLNDYGIKSIRGPRGISQELLDELNK